MDEERRDLDNRRARLESTYTNRNPGSPYEVQFREYMQQLTSPYFSRLRNELFKGFDEYDNGAEGYMQFFNQISDVCEKEYSRVAEYTNNAVNATDRAIQKISDAVSGIFKIVGIKT